MRHARPEDLEPVRDLLAKIREHEGLIEKKVGTFYCKSSAFLHFHADPAGMFADLKIDGEFQRFRVTTRAEQAAFLRELTKAAAPRSGRSRDTRRAE